MTPPSLAEQLDDTNAEPVFALALHDPAAPALTPGKTSPPAIDNQRRLRVVVEGGGGGGGGGTSSGLQSAYIKSDAAYAAFLAFTGIKNVQSIHLRYEEPITGPVYVWLFDCASVDDVAEANALRPFGEELNSPPLQIGYLDFPADGVRVTNGLVVALSSSPNMWIPSPKTARYFIQCAAEVP